MKSTTKSKNILLIRSAANTLNATINSLKNEFPDSKITVLAPESAREGLENHPNVDAIISAGTINRMTLFSLENKVIRKIRISQFDVAVSLYNVDHGMGYSNIDFLAWLSGAKNIRGYNTQGTFSEFNGWSVLKKYFLEKTSFTWFVINALTTVLLFTFITLGFLLEWPIRKIYSITSSNKKITSTKKKVNPQQHTGPSRVHNLTPEARQEV
ncbi:uncharacterized protein METZ01_LOCUS328128 [marine metagenome]|uniref:Uncharacterized protein n=1 Tax=marine metagenome TaxID=408172 RepID=A0A382PPL2_9ZZZZ